MKDQMKETAKNSVIFISTIVLLWIKTYIVYKMAFEFEIENVFQELILFLNPLSSIVFCLAFALLVSAKWRNAAAVLLSIGSTVILYANVIFYREFTDFITIPLLFQKSNMNELGGSISSLVSWTDVFVFTDTVLMIALILWKKNQSFPVQKRTFPFLILFSVGLFTFNLALAEIQRPELLTRAFDREMLIKNIGTYNYHLYDVMLQSKTKAQKTMAKEGDLTEVQTYIEKQKTPSNEELFGIAKGKNVIVISMESTQSFAINKRLNGKEITPFINSLIRDQEAFYFDNFYHQVGQGKTSDAEFIVDNSLFPLPRGAVYFTNAQNKYLATPRVLKEEGYYTASFHANNKSFWNRDIMYKNLGYDQYYSDTFYKINDQNSIGWGLNDIDFFKQSVQMMKKIEQPFYTRLLTLTNHHPFVLNDDQKWIDEYHSNSGTLNRYFPTVRFTDESLKVFFEELKKAGLYDDSIIIIYGDHYGISENHKKAMSKFTGKTITAYESAMLQRVPLIIKVPGVKGETIHKVSGQIDIRPTLFNLLGVEVEEEIRFGNDLFSTESDAFALFRNGNFITENYVYAENACYSKEFGKKVELSKCEPYFDKAKKDLEHSDKLIYGDLLRFLPEKTDKEAGEKQENKEKEEGQTP